jgi:hypothetical protein
MRLVGLFMRLVGLFMRLVGLFMRLGRQTTLVGLFIGIVAGLFLRH